MQTKCVLIFVLSLLCVLRDLRGEISVKGIALAEEGRGASYGSEVCQKQLAAIKEIGGNWIAISPFAWMRGVTDPHVTYGRGRDWDENNMAGCIADAHSMQIKVLLKPHIWCNQFWNGNKWHGDIAMTSEADWDTWFDEYGQYILASAKIAETTKCDALCIGVEYQGTSATQEKRWRKLIADVRQVYHGKLTYAASWGEYPNVKWWAQMADGKISGPHGARMQISNTAATHAVHQLRSQCDAMLVGVNTVLSDDPMLTARDVQRSRLQTRIILDSTLRTPIESKLARTANELPVELYFTRDGFISAGPERIKQLMASGINLIATDADDDGRISIPKLLSRESFDEMMHLLVEPGPTLARSFFDAGAADRVWIIQSPRTVNSTDAIDAPKLPSRYVKSGEVNLDGDVLSEYLDRESDLFFSRCPSADLVLTASTLSLTHP